MTPILLSLLFIVSTIHAMTADDLKFCKFLAEKVFSPGEYKTTQELMCSDNAIDFSALGDLIAPNNSVTFEQFIVQYVGSICYIRGQVKNFVIDPPKYHWSTILEIDFKKKDDSKKEIKITGDESDYSKIGLIKYFRKVNWVTIAHDVALRNTFEYFWTNDELNAAKKNNILQIASSEFKGDNPTISMMEYAASTIKIYKPVSTEKREEKKNDNNTNSKNVGDEFIKPGNGTINNNDENKSKDGDQLTKPENGTANKDHEDKSKDKNQPTKMESGTANKNHEDKSKDQNQLKKSENETTHKDNEDKTKDENQPTNMENKTATDDKDEEKTIFANPYITWSIIFVLSIGWFFFFKYIRDRCLEEDDDIEYNSEFSYMEEDEGEEWPDV